MSYCQSCANLGSHIDKIADEKRKAEERMAGLLKIIANPAVCGGEQKNGCGELIFWIVTKQNKRMPLNGDGSAHFSTCVKVANFRK
jgi:hypothetical protein